MCVSCSETNQSLRLLNIGRPLLSPSSVLLEGDLPNLHTAYTCEVLRLQYIRQTRTQRSRVRHVRRELSQPPTAALCPSANTDLRGLSPLTIQRIRPTAGQVKIHILVGWPHNSLVRCCHQMFLLPTVYIVVFSSVSWEKE